MNNGTTKDGAASCPGRLRLACAKTHGLLFLSRIIIDFSFYFLYNIHYKTVIPDTPAPEVPL
jgi:hypothetical protein